MSRRQPGNWSNVDIELLHAIVKEFDAMEDSLLAQIQTIRCWSGEILAEIERRNKLGRINEESERSAIAAGARKRVSGRG